MSRGSLYEVVFGDIIIIITIMITTIITWVIVLPEGEEGAAAGAAHGDRPGAAGLHDSCDSLYDSLVTAYLSLPSVAGEDVEETEVAVEQRPLTPETVLL